MFTSNINGGRGWIAFCDLLSGQLRPRGTVLERWPLVWLTLCPSTFRRPQAVRLSLNELIIALPYILTILLTIRRKNFNVPAKLGVPYSLKADCGTAAGMESGDEHSRTAAE